MQRLNRPAHAPMGAAFFLFLGLAILPVSLRIAGVQISFSPRLSAAMDAWEQISEVLGGGSRSSTDLSVAPDLNSADGNSIDGDRIPLHEFACSHSSENSAEELSGDRLKDVRITSPRRAFTKPALRDPFATRRTVSIVVAGFDGRARPIGVQGARKLQTMTREEMLKSIADQVRPNIEAIAGIGNFPITMSRFLRAPVRAKRPVASSSAKAAEFKVFRALDSARRRECDRAVLTSLPSTNSENSEF